jgi:hypothetical protein
VEYDSLPTEPTEGTTIATFVGGERYIRRFDPKARAADVYAWVAGQTIDFDDNQLFFDEFELRMPMERELTVTWRLKSRVSKEELWSKCMKFKCV